MTLWGLLWRATALLAAFLAAFGLMYLIVNVL